MQNELKIKLENLSEKFNTDLDIISLKALCVVPESEEILFAITGTLNRLMEKYPDDEEILRLLPKKEKISLEDLIKILEETYPNNVEVITIKALSALPEGESKENAIAQSLERLLDENSNDENILEYLGIEDIVPKEKNPDMVFVEGGSYFFFENINILDLYVNKYQTTQGNYERYMRENPSEFLGERRPVENITWIQALKYCNELSKKYGFQPAYKIENNKLTRIFYKNGEEVYPDLVDFSKVEGYRLPIEAEWEWFAKGGQIAIKNKTFDGKYAGTKYSQEEIEEMQEAGEFIGGEYADEDELANEVAWFDYNSENETHAVGTKRANELGLYDCSGNVGEWCYDTHTDGYISKEKPYVYDSSTDYHILKGGSWENYFYDCDIDSRYYSNFHNEKIGFRIVRTANPKK